MNYEQEIRDRLIAVLSSSELYPFCFDAYASALAGMGLSDEKIHAEKVLNILKKEGLLRDKEQEIWIYLRGLTVNGVNFEQHADSLVSDRRRIMFEQISSSILPEGNIADFGAGNGEFMRLIASRFPKLDLEGWDIVSDDPMGKVQIYDGKRVPRDDGFYQQVYATTVLHHLKDPIAGAKEIARLSRKRIILIETIAGTRTDDRTKDWDITFVADYFWRLMHKSSEPVPGSYLTVFEWIELFTQKLGCNLSAFTDFGNDQKTMTEKHVLLVFDKTTA